jgi:solute carrier family 8 (sodium/calcium exchanger)
MEAIEVITSETKQISITDAEGKVDVVDVPVWNATIANLTLMALGSSAPEILLSVMGVVTNLGKPADVLGPCSIVGSAAFNLLVISAVSILAIGDEIKYIYDMGVFAVTALSSIFAYVWMFLCLSVNTPEEVTLTEAWLTFVFFIILVIVAFAADKYNESKMKKIQDAH